MDFTCLFSRLIDSFNKPESLTTIKVCWTTTWQSLNHLFHRFSQWIDQPVCSEPKNQSINHAIGRYCGKKQNYLYPFVLPQVNLWMCLWLFSSSSSEILTKSTWYVCYVIMSRTLSQFIYRNTMKFTNTRARKPLDINYFKSIKLIDCEFLSHISTWQFFKTREKYEFPGADVSLTNPVSCFGNDGVIAYST